jgi:1-acyl-sn-glycerol-3-phosphate acyltransferase
MATNSVTTKRTAKKSPGKAKGKAPAKAKAREKAPAKTTARKKSAATAKKSAAKAGIAGKPVTADLSANKYATEYLPGQGLNGPDSELMEAQSGFWDMLMDRYFRLDISGFENLPDEPCLLIGVHSGGPLTMDAWTVIMAWWREFGESRSLHGTAHDVLMNAPVLGEYFRRLGAISPSKENINAAFQRGDDVILWPGGEVDSYRTWKNRDKAVLGGRKGFIRLAMRAGVPIVPVATVGGHDTLFVLSEGRGLAKMLKLKERIRSEVAPITLSWPFGIALHLTPFQHLPLPAKIRTEIMAPIYVDSDPARLDDQPYVEQVYADIEETIQSGMDKLARKRRFPIFG